MMVEPELLDRCGILAGTSNVATSDQALLITHLISEDGTSVIQQVGGDTLNVARGFSSLLGEPRSICVGAIGVDPEGEEFIRFMSRTGVKGLYEAIPGEHTGWCLVLVTPDAERTFLVDMGAGLQYGLDHFMDARVQYHLHDSQMLYVSGYSLRESCEPLQMLRTHAVEYSKPLGLNLADVNVVQSHPTDVLDLIDCATHVFGNQEEYRALATSAGLLCCVEDFHQTVSITSVLEALFDRPRHSPLPVQEMHVTNGPGEITVAWQEGRSQFACSTFDVPSVPHVVDTNGAGDSYVAGVLAGSIQGLGLEKCVALGCHLAGTVIQSHGLVYPGESLSEEWTIN